MLIVVSSCVNKTNSNDILQEFNLLNSKDRIWAHKVNSLNSVANRVAQFRGVEVDIFYNYEEDNFEIKHDIDSIGIDLEYYLDSISKIKELYFWFDYKNLKSNTDSGILKLYSILTQRELDNKCFVESYFAKELVGFKGKLATSFWLSETKIPELKSERDQLYQEKYKYIETCNIDMLSANFRMFDFITEYFPNYKCNYWVFNELTDVKMKKLKKLSMAPNVNIILIDGLKNVLKY
jgi:hypothetical protein